MKFLKIFLALISVGLICCQATNQSSIESENFQRLGKQIRVSSGSTVSTYGIFVTEIMNIGLEELGYKTEPIKQLDVPIIHIAVSNGDVVDGKNLGIAVDRIRIIANNNFLADNPAAKRLFELISISIEDVNAQQKLVQDGETNAKDIRRHAEEWVKTNQEKFDSWLEEARAILH